MMPAALFDELASHVAAQTDAIFRGTPGAATSTRNRTDEAKAVLEHAASGEGLAAFEASEVLNRWVEGA
ncbi:hypothetical protein D7X32_25595 [Corallococcus carmarthensis]|uniref:Uncharacterized protein n=1 Tax=Corallococcus carmarthensis TaxID=2316728 RepID=A0A3A8JXY0_9BACT|nr:hypothetical protein D7X32_25595 [Corallococcus carmarthensis]